MGALAANVPRPRRGLWLVRHGALAADGERRLVGARDLPMSDEGRAQIRALARDFMPRIGSALSALVCSDLSRCRETAALLLEACADTPPLVVEPGFREIGLGLWEGLNREAIRRRWPGAFEARGRDMANFIPPAGESFRMVERRALEALFRLRTRHPQGLVLVVTHAGVMRALLSRYWGLPLERVWHIPQDYACRRFLPGW